MRTTRSGDSREKTNSEKDGGFLIESNGKIYSASSRACPKCNRNDTLLPSDIIIDGKMTCTNLQCMQEYTLKMEKDISSSLVSSESKEISCLTLFKVSGSNVICSKCSGFKLRMMARKKKKKSTRNLSNRCERPWNDSNRIHSYRMKNDTYQIAMQEILAEKTEQDFRALSNNLPACTTKSEELLPRIKKSLVRVSSLAHKKLKNSAMRPHLFFPKTSRGQGSNMTTKRRVNDLAGSVESPIHTQPRLLSPKHDNSSLAQGPDICAINPRRSAVLGDITNTCSFASKVAVTNKCIDNLKNSMRPHLFSPNAGGQRSNKQCRPDNAGDINPRNVLGAICSPFASKSVKSSIFNDDRMKSNKENEALGGFNQNLERPGENDRNVQLHHLQPSRALFCESSRDCAKSILDDLFKSTEKEVMNELLRERGFCCIPPKSQILVNKAHLCNLQNIKEYALKGRKKLNLKQYKSHSSLQRRFNAFSALLAPTVSQDKMETVSQLSRAATLEEFEIKPMVCGLSGRGKIHEDSWDDRMSKTGISHSTVGNLTGEAATDLVFLLREELLLVESLFANTDKGQGGHMVKVLSWFSFVKNRVDKFIIDVDKCSGFSSETAAAIKYSMDRIFIDKKYRVDGGATDAGGGGTGQSLKKEMMKLDIMPSWACVAFCALHGIQLIFKTPIETALGFGGLGIRSPLQLLHDYYDLQIAMGKTLWDKRWREAAEKLGIPMIDEHGEETDKVPWLQEPVMSRWWTVGQGAKQVSNNEAILIEVLLRTIESKRANSEEAVFKIAANALSLALEKEIQSDIKLIKGFAKFFLDDHMNWFQLGDARIGDTAGFNSRNMLVRYFLMHYDLNRLAGTEECWRNAIEFKDFMATLDGPENGEIVKQDEHTLLRDLRSVPIRKKSVQIKKARMIFDEALKQLHSVAHFTPYRKELLFLALFGEHETSRILASKIRSKGESTAAGSGSYYCPHQKREIDLKAFEEFLDWVGIDENAEKIKTDWNQVADERNFHHMAIFSKDDLEAIVSKDIWEEEGPSVSANLVHRFKMNYSALPSTTHFVERGVKIAGISSNSKRSDTRATHYAIGSNFTEDVNRVTIETMKSEFNYKNEEAIVPRGKVFSKHLLARIEKMDTDINALCLDEGKAAVYKEIHTRLNKEKLAFRHDLTKFAVDAGDKQQQKRKGMKAPKASLVRGVDRTEAMNGAFCFKFLKRDKHWDMLGMELEARGLDAPFDMNFTQLKQLVHDDEGMERKGFIPKFSSLDQWSRAGTKKQDRDQKKNQITKARKKEEKLQQSGRAAGTIRSSVEVENQ